MNLRHHPRLAAAIPLAEAFAVYALSLTIIVALQILGGAYASGFGGDNDEAAHLVTSLMARDFIAGLDFRHPWQFAEQYYYHYPKVMIGVWPPMFYGALGTWFLIVGASRGAALMFIAVTAATTSSILYFIGKRMIGRWAGSLAAVLFMVSPLVQESSAEVMHEHLSTLAILVSTLCLARFARTERIIDGLAFGTAAAAAILTHGNAWALGLIPASTIALTDRWYLIRRLGLWLAPIPVLVTCVPWYVFTLGIIKNSFTGSVTSFWLQAVPGLTWFIYSGVGLSILICSLIGIWTTIIRVTPRAAVHPEWAALGSVAFATFILYCVLPVSVEARYMVVVLPPLFLFSAAGVNQVARLLDNRLPAGAVRVGLAVMLLAVFTAESFALPLQRRNEGYEVLVRDVMARVSNVPQVWLISSDAIGEGCFVSAIALQETQPKSYVLRAKTLLGGGDMFWNDMQDRFDTPAKLARILDDLSVSIIVIDNEIPPGHRRPYQDRLRELVTDEGDKWEPIGSYPQIKGGVPFTNSLHVYARRPVASLTNRVPAIWLDRLKALMVRKELR